MCRIEQHVKNGAQPGRDALVRDAESSRRFALVRGVVSRESVVERSAADSGSGLPLGVGHLRQTLISKPLMADKSQRRMHVAFGSQRRPLRDDARDCNAEDDPHNVHRCVRSSRGVENTASASKGMCGRGQWQSKAPARLASMSERNGDRARFQKNRKRKLHHRQCIQALRLALRNRAAEQASTREASLNMHDEGGPARIGD